MSSKWWRSYNSSSINELRLVDTFSHNNMWIGIHNYCNWHGTDWKILSVLSMSISAFVSLVSILELFKTSWVGFISEILLHKYSISRPFFISLVLLVLSICHLFVALTIPGSFYITSIMIGMCFGLDWPLMFSIIFELFDLHHFAILYNIVVSASPLGAYLLFVRIGG